MSLPDWGCGQGTGFPGVPTEAPVEQLELEAVVLLALAHFVHMDKANAAIHCGEVRFSPMTFRLAEAVPHLAATNDDVAEVWQHRGAYEEDRGR
jgi:hypothetical protein